MNIKLEDWTSLASLGLSAMFVTLLLSLYNFLIGPNSEGPERVVNSSTLMLQIIFISGAPGLALAGFAFGMAKSFGTKIGGIAVLAGGIIMTAGMAASLSLVSRIQEQYTAGVVGAAPYFFMAAGIGMAAVGAYMIAALKKRRRLSDLDDLR